MEKTIDKKTPLVNLYNEIQEVTNKYLKIENVNIEKGTITFNDRFSEQKTITTKDDVIFLDPSGKGQALNVGKPIIHVDAILHRYVDTYYDEDEDDYVEDENEIEEHLEFKVNIYFLSNMGNHHYMTLSPSDMKPAAIPFNSPRNNARSYYTGIPHTLMQEFLEKYSYNDSYDEAKDDDDSTLMGSYKYLSFVIFNGKKYSLPDFGKLILETKPKGTFHVGTRLLGNSRSYLSTLQINSEEYEYNLEDISMNNLPIDTLNIYRSIHGNLEGIPFILQKLGKKNALIEIDFMLNPYRGGKYDNSSALKISSFTLDTANNYFSQKDLMTFPAEVPHPDCCGASQMYSHTHSGSDGLEKWKKVLDKYGDLIYLWHLKKTRATRFSFIVPGQIQSSKYYYEKVFGNHELIDEFTNINTGTTISIFKIDAHSRLMYENQDGYTINHNRWQLANFLTNHSIDDTELILYQWFKNSEEAKSKKTTKTVVKNHTVTAKKKQTFATKNTQHVSPVWNIQHTPMKGHVQARRSGVIHRRKT